MSKYTKFVPTFDVFLMLSMKDVVDMNNLTSPFS